MEQLTDIHSLPGRKEPFGKERGLRRAVGLGLGPKGPPPLIHNLKERKLVVLKEIKSGNERHLKIVRCLYN